MKSMRMQGWRGDPRRSHETPRREAWACVTGGKDRRGEATVNPRPLQGRPATTEPAKIALERVVLKLEPIPRPVKGELGALRGRV